MQLNKKGFVLMETIIVMTVLSIALIYLYTTYVKVLGSASKVSYYDNVEDMYTAYYASKLYSKIKRNNKFYFAKYENYFN